MHRLERLAKTAGTSPWVIPYLTAGYPAKEETLDLLRALERGGADAIEVGLPFSDPLADGPVIQATSQASLDGGTTTPWILETVAAFRRESDLPILVMGYLNPMMRFGLEAFFEKASEVGVDGLIVPDVPPEEAKPLQSLADKANLSWVFLAAPTSGVQRLKQVDACSTHFSYCVAVTGVTGSRQSLPDDIKNYLAEAKSSMEKPFVVGFGISEAKHVTQVCPPAAGVVVGSALLKAIGEAPNPASRVQVAEDFMKALRP